MTTLSAVHQATKKLTPGDYITAVIDSFGDRRILYQSTRYVNEVFQDLFISLHALNASVNGVNARLNTHPAIHPKDDILFVHKVIQQLSHITTMQPRVLVMIANTINLLGTLLDAIENHTAARRARQDAARQAIANGYDDDISSSDE